jgi:hypothetical protein
MSLRPRPTSSTVTTRGSARAVPRWRSSRSPRIPAGAASSGAAARNPKYSPRRGKPTVRVTHTTATAARAWVALAAGRREVAKARAVLRSTSSSLHQYQKKSSSSHRRSPQHTPGRRTPRLPKLVTNSPPWTSALTKPAGQGLSRRATTAAILHHRADRATAADARRLPGNRIPRACHQPQTRALRLTAGRRGRIPTRRRR